MPYSFDETQVTLALAIGRGFANEDGDDFWTGWASYADDGSDAGLLAKLFAERAASQITSPDDVLDLIELVLWGSGGWRELGHPRSGAIEPSTKDAARVSFEAYVGTYLQFVADEITAALMLPVFGSD